MSGVRCLCSLSPACSFVRNVRQLSVSGGGERKNWISRVMTGPESGAGASSGQISASHSSLLADKEVVYELSKTNRESHIINRDRKSGLKISNGVNWFSAMRALPGEFKNYLEHYEEHAKLLQSKNLGLELLGSWRTMVGEASETVHLWKHTDGYNSTDKLLEAQLTDKDIIESLNDQEKLCSKRITTLMLKFAFWDDPKPRPGKHIYELRSYILKPGQMIEWGNNWSRGINFRKDYDQGVGGFFSQVGRLYMVFHFWAYKDLATRKKIRDETWQKPGWDVNVTYTVPLIRRMRTRLMVPNSFSRMQ